MMEFYSSRVTSLLKCQEVKITPLAATVDVQMDSSNATFSFMFLVDISYKSLILRVVLELCSFAPVALISLFSSV